MRALSLIELENKISTDSYSIFYSERIYAQDKISQFFTFIHTQPISKRIIERINEDFAFIKIDIFPLENYNPNIKRVRLDHKVITKVKENIKSREDQGALGFFVIQELFEIETKYENHYLDAPKIWYNGVNSDFNNRFDWLVEKFFKPLVELLQWYIYESQVRSEKDHFSKSEIKDFNDKLDKILSTQTASSQVIFDEINELRELILYLNKKNLGEILKGKFQDLILGLALSPENAAALYNDITRDFPPLLQ